jgi:hypothetical protein
MRDPLSLFDLLFLHFFSDFVAERNARKVYLSQLTKDGGFDGQSFRVVKFVGRVVILIEFCHFLPKLLFFLESFLFLSFFFSFGDGGKKLFNYFFFLLLFVLGCFSLIVIF